MASEEKTASAIVFGIRWCSCSVVASGPPDQEPLDERHARRIPPEARTPRSRRACHTLTERRDDPPRSMLDEPDDALGTHRESRRRREAPCTSSSWAAAGWAASSPSASRSSGHTVAVIDKDPRRVPPLAGDLRRARRSSGFGFDRDAPRSRPASRGPARVAAVTSGDNSNILAARIARENFGIERVVARIYDPRRAVIYQRLGIPTVATVSWTTDQVMRRLLPSDEQPHDGSTRAARSASSTSRSRPGGRARSSPASSEPGLFWLVGVTRLGDAQVRTPSVDRPGRRHPALRRPTCDALDALRERLQQGSEQH